MRSWVIKEKITYSKLQFTNRRNNTILEQPIRMFSSWFWKGEIAEKYDYHESCVPWEKVAPKGTTTTSSVEIPSSSLLFCRSLSLRLLTCLPSFVFDSNCFLWSFCKYFTNQYWEEKKQSEKCVLKEDRWNLQHKSWEQCADYI